MYVCALKNLKKFWKFIHDLFRNVFILLLLLGIIYKLIYILFREVFTKLAMDQDRTTHTLQEKQETKP
jgi:hypothetical protein